jgi:hypothetical protein
VSGSTRNLLRHTSVSTLLDAVYGVRKVSPLTALQTAMAKLAARGGRLEAEIASRAADLHSAKQATKAGTRPKSEFLATVGDNICAPRRTASSA